MAKETKKTMELLLILHILHLFLTKFGTCPTKFVLSLAQRSQTYYLL